MDIKPLSARAARAIQYEVGQVLEEFEAIRQELTQLRVTDCGNNYLINNILYEGSSVVEQKVYSTRVKIVAEAAGYIMHTYGLEFMGLSDHGNGSVVLGKGFVPMLAIGTAVWGDNSRRESLALYSDLILRARGTPKTLFGGSVTSLVGRADPRVFDPSEYAFLTDDNVRILAESSIAAARYRTYAPPNYDMSTEASKELFKKIIESSTGIINFSALDPDSHVSKWYEATKRSLEKNLGGNEEHEAIKAHMKQGAVAITSMSFMHDKPFGRTNFFSVKNRHSVMVIRPDEFGVAKIVSRRYISDLSEIEHEYPHVVSAFKLREIESGRPYYFNAGFSESYGCITFTIHSVPAKMRPQREKASIFTAMTSVFPEEMYIDKGVVPDTPAVTPADAIPTLDF